MFEPKITLTFSLHTVLFSGQLDKLGLEKVRKELEKFVHDFSGQEIIFDFSKLEFLNSEAIGFLVALQTHCKKNGRSLRLININEHVRDVLDTVGLLTVFSA